MPAAHVKAGKIFYPAGLFFDELVLRISFVLIEVGEALLSGANKTTKPKYRATEIQRYYVMVH